MHSQFSLIFSICGEIFDYYQSQSKISVADAITVKKKIRKIENEIKREEEEYSVVLTDNRTISPAIEVLMALVVWSRYTTVRHSAAETSGPPQEVRHTCSGVCVPIIRSVPLFSPKFVGFSTYSAFHIRRLSPERKKKTEKRRA